MDMLSTKITYLTGVGPKRAEVLKEEIEVRTYLDLLHYFPFRYVDRSRFYAIREIRSDMPYIQLRGVLRNFSEVGEGRRKRLTATFSDGTGSIELVWFKGIKYIRDKLQEGRRYIVFGKPAFFASGYNIAHPEIDAEEKAEQVAGGLTPIYHTTERMKSMGLGSKQLQQLLYVLLNQVSATLTETLPPYILSSYGFVSYQEAIRQIHFPQGVAQLEAARTRLKFEELFYVQLHLIGSKLERKARFQGIVFAQVGALFNTFYKEHLPFELTGAQKRVVREIRQDTLSGHQMNRLVQGDVGSGKTLVALLSMLLALDNGCQACLMAPTEILARQHHHTLSELLRPLGVEVGLLIGSCTARQRERLLPCLADGSISIVVGTHALLEQGVVFHRLGMAVIDEQHRFGVQQRARLWEKNLDTLPHILIMSATPIPRTLAMTLYGDLDISIIDELPPGRKPIQTLHHFDNDMAPVFRFLRSQLAAGRQVYVVYPMIEGSETTDLKNLEDGFELFSSIFPDEGVTMVHGKMKAKEKEARMVDFVSGRSRILLATTVIEVGVNVPNATVMVVENADRFGLSQLHQLRGRVGRGGEQSYCILITGTKIGEDSRRRIQVMVETNDGFEIAEEDMRLRGFGDLEGTRQSGRQISLRIANPARDTELIALSRSIAERLLERDPELRHPDNQMLALRLNKLFPKEEDWSVIS
ncbi:ATP-dependent DNA helicase RecG [Porphyromonas gulae]|uniref:ATP-dependent DNA helicase RecG n=1 Tax=Porphyromonas gulae TaxID=111105 RepID=A0A0A2FDU3_9PORP|nr:ATP-dependent DNA helicase RecG [Porphyromonas gulae]KGN88267.1 ATP-dependent DNA helicase RecG [Porphyromonas gulae]